MQVEGLKKYSFSRLWSVEEPLWRSFLFAFFVPGLLAEAIRALIVINFFTLLAALPKTPLYVALFLAVFPIPVWCVGGIILLRCALKQRSGWLRIVVCVGAILVSLVLTTQELVVHGLRWVTQTTPAQQVTSVICKHQLKTEKNPVSRLFIASGCNDLDEVQKLVESGLDVSTRNTKEPTSATFNGRTALHYAANQGSLSVINYLINHGADVNAKNGKGYTPLYYAASYNKAEAVSLLLTKGADPNLMGELGGPLHIAVSHQQAEAVDILLSGGADANLRRDFDGGTPLHWYVIFATQFSSKDIRILDSLAKHGVNFNALDKRGTTPLDSNHLAGSVGPLVMRGARLSNVDDIFSLLNKVARSGSTDALKYLKAEGFSLQTKGPDGQTLLHDAGMFGHVQVIEYLIANGLDMDAIDREGRTPLDKALLACKKNSIEYFIEKGAKSNIDHAQKPRKC